MVPWHSRNLPRVTLRCGTCALGAGRKRERDDLDRRVLGEFDGDERFLGVGGQGVVFEVAAGLEVVAALGVAVGSDEGGMLAGCRRVGVMGEGEAAGVDGGVAVDEAEVAGGVIVR